MPNSNKKLVVCLSTEFRAELEGICRRQSVGAAKVRRARILLMSDADHPDGGRRDREIAEVVGLSERQVVRIRQQFVREGEPVLQRKTRKDAGIPKTFDGEAEAKLVTLCCNAPPDGRDRWTLQLLCDELARLKVVESVCRETVRRCLKKTNLNLGEPSGSAFRRMTAPASLHGWNRSSTPTRKSTTHGTS